MFNITVHADMYAVSNGMVIYLLMCSVVILVFTVELELRSRVLPNRMAILSTIISSFSLTALFSFHKWHTVISHIIHMQT